MLITFFYLFFSMKIRKFATFIFHSNLNNCYVKHSKKNEQHVFRVAKFAGHSHGLWSFGTNFGVELDLVHALRAGYQPDRYCVGGRSHRRYHCATHCWCAQRQSVVYGWSSSSVDIFWRAAHRIDVVGVAEYSHYSKHVRCYGCRRFADYCRGGGVDARLVD